MQLISTLTRKTGSCGFGDDAGEAFWNDTAIRSLAAFEIGHVEDFASLYRLGAVFHRDSKASHCSARAKNPATTTHGLSDG